MMQLDRDQLARIVGPAAAPYAERHRPAINAAMRRWGIDTPRRAAHFVGQLAVESGGFRHTTEIWPHPRLDDRGRATSGSSWQLKYEGRAELGNTEPGDGYRFRGRGLIQLTGRANYRAYGRAVGIDLERNPDRVAADLAADVAGWYWKRRDINAAADKNDTAAVTRRINPALLGLARREEYTRRALAAIGTGGGTPWLAICGGILAAITLRRTA